MCGVGESFIYIQSNGYYTLCPTLSSREDEKFILGHINKDCISDIWNKNEIIKEIRGISCSKIDCKYLDKCKGGCRSRAILFNDNSMCSYTCEDPVMCMYFEQNCI